MGDITRVGLVITGSETGGSLPVARGHTLRLICTNGATVPRAFGEVWFSSDWRIHFDRRLAAFEAELGALTLQVDRLREAYDRLIAETITDFGFYNLYRSVRYVYRHAPQGETRADQALGVEPERRREIIAQARQRQAELRTGVSSGAWVQGSTEFVSWDVFNQLTATAREEPYQRRVALERIAGGLLQPPDSRALPIGLE